MSIRYKIFGVFSIVIVLACGLAFYGIRGISSTGDIVVRLYDGPLMGINHARSAHAALNEAHLIMQRGLSEGASNESVAKFDKLLGNAVFMSERSTVRVLAYSGGSSADLVSGTDSAINRAATAKIQITTTTFPIASRRGAASNIGGASRSLLLRINPPLPSREGRGLR